MPIPYDQETLALDPLPDIGESLMTKQFAVIGNPIEQSRSPELHHAFAAKTGVDLNYKKILAPLDGFESADRKSVV